MNCRPTDVYEARGTPNPPRVVITRNVAPQEHAQLIGGERNSGRRPAEGLFHNLGTQWLGAERLPVPVDDAPQHLCLQGRVLHLVQQEPGLLDAGHHPRQPVVHLAFVATDREVVARRKSDTYPPQVRGGPRPDQKALWSKADGLRDPFVNLLNERERPRPAHRHDT